MIRTSDICKSNSFSSAHLGCASRVADELSWQKDENVSSGHLGEAHEFLRNTGLKLKGAYEPPPEDMTYLFEHYVGASSSSGVSGQRIELAESE